MVEDRYGDITEKTIMDSILPETKKMCITKQGEAFSFEPVHMSFFFWENYVYKKGILRNKWALESESVETQVTTLQKKVNTVASKLPEGISVEILTRKASDSREQPAFFGAKAMASFCCWLKVSVAQEYSQKLYESMCDEYVVHDPNTTSAFRKEAMQFCDLLREKHMETVEKIAEYPKKYRYKGYMVGLKEVVDTPFSYWGMANLSSWAQAYGLAMLIAEAINKDQEKIIRQRLKHYEYFISADDMEEKAQLKQW